METENPEYVFEVREWRIENFSCFIPDVHNDCIESTSTGLYFFPRENGLMRVGVADILHSPYIELYFISSDGSLILKQVANEPVYVENLAMLPYGPEFKEVVAKIRLNKDLFKDILTIRCHLKRKAEKDYPLQWQVISANTILRSYVSHVKIPLKIFKDFTYQETSEIFSFSAPIKKVNINFLLTGSLDRATGSLEDAHILFELSPMEFPHPANYGMRTCIYLLDNNESVLKCKFNEHVFSYPNRWKFNSMFKMTELMEKEGYLIFGCTFISGDVTDNILVRGNCFTTYPDRNESADSSLIVLSKDIEDLQRVPDFSDFQLKCGQVSFPVHRNILSARSPFFRSLLRSKDASVAFGFSDLSNLDVNTVKQFLIYLYCGKIKDLNFQKAVNGYKAATEFGVDSLKKKCVEFLCDNVSTSNLYDIFSLASSYGDRQLLSVVYDFITRNYSQVVRSESWNRLLESDPRLLLITLTDLSAAGFIGRKMKL